MSVPSRQNENTHNSEGKKTTKKDPASVARGNFGSIKPMQ